MKPSKLAGLKFNSLKVIRRFGSDKLKRILWLCRCDCGKICKATTWGLRTGNNKSCGCLRHRFGMDNPTAIHGHCPKKGQRTPEWRAYHNARQRCINPHNISYPYYGARGIEFHYSSFVEFLRDVANRRMKMIIDFSDYEIRQEFLRRAL